MPVMPEGSAETKHALYCGNRKSLKHKKNPRRLSYRMSAPEVTGIAPTATMKVRGPVEENPRERSIVPLKHRHRRKSEKFLGFQVCYSPGQTFFRKMANCHRISQWRNSETVQKPPLHYFANPGVILSARISLPGLNRIVLPGGIATSSPVLGLRPTPLLRGLTIKTPNPLNSIRSLRRKAPLSELNTESTAVSAITLVMSICSATRFTISCLITTNLPKSLSASI